MKLAYQEFMKKYSSKMFNNFQCHTYYYRHIRPAVFNEVKEGDNIYVAAVGIGLQNSTWQAK